ncbi:MAG: PH domain-containing protein, partial [Acidimicrobiia bacterium]|nr:PH domain-containing protein [Acidimicrobiia bacterium]
MTTPSDPGDGERRLSPVTALLAVLDRSLVFPVVALVFGAGRSRFAWVFLLLAGLTLVSGVVRWWRTTWTVRSGALRVRSGLLARQEQVVPLDRVQQVTVVEDLRHRLFGVAALRVEVAGGGSSVALDALDRATATAVRQELLAVRAVAADALDVAPAFPPPPPPERLVVA